MLCKPVKLMRNVMLLSSMVLAALQYTPAINAEGLSSFSGDKQMYEHQRTDLAIHRGELSATTSKHRVLVVITKGQSSANYTVVVHLADKRGNNSPYNNTSRQPCCRVWNA